MFVYKKDTNKRYVKRKILESLEEFSEDNDFRFVKQKPLKRIRRAVSKLKECFYNFAKNIVLSIISTLIASLLLQYIILH
ncbi:MAG: hypothetical protein J7J99_06160 [Thermoprotei archaeon]|nr:hypothetical protein [Thermoprotei archaeon]